MPRSSHRPCPDRRRKGIRYVVLAASMVAPLVAGGCDPVTGPEASDGREIRPALVSLTAHASDPTLGGGLVLAGRVSDPEDTPDLHDVIPVVVEGAGGDREAIGLRRLWDDDVRGLYQIVIVVGAAANIASPAVTSRLREIGAVYSFHFHDRHAFYVTTVPYQWARVAVEGWPHAMATPEQVVPSLSVPHPRLQVGGGLPATADPPVPGDGILQVQPGETLMIEYVDDHGEPMELPPFTWSIE